MERYDSEERKLLKSYFCQISVPGCHYSVLINHIVLVLICISCFNIKAGIPGNQLEIALEPEAASIYCHLMHLDETQKDNTIKSFTRGPGEKYMMVDLGGTYYLNSKMLPVIHVGMKVQELQLQEKKIHNQLKRVTIVYFFLHACYLYSFLMMSYL